MQEMQRTRVQSLGQEDPLEVEMTTHSSILAWEIPWTEEPGSLQSMGSQRTGHDLLNKQQLKTSYKPAAQRSWGGAPGAGEQSVRAKVPWWENWVKESVPAKATSQCVLALSCGHMMLFGAQWRLMQDGSNLEILLKLVH